MGGNIFDSKRYSKYEFLELWKELYEKLSKYIKNPQKNIILIKSYEDKESFGDMDIIVCEEAANNAGGIKPIILTLSDQISVNGNIVSFLYKDFQIDIILTKQENLIISDTFFAYNDLGNLMGRIANSLKLQYCWDGLKYKVYSSDKSRLLDTIVLSKDPEVIFNFLGFDYSRFLKGFKTVEEIFEFVISSKYFVRDIFHIENLDHENRTRNRKRKNYMLFLVYVRYKSCPINTLPENKEEFVIAAFNLGLKIFYLQDLDEMRQRSKKFINGHILLKLGVEPKKIGPIIDLFKEDMYYEYMNNMTEEERLIKIKESIRYHEV